MQLCPKCQPEILALKAMKQLTQDDLKPCDIPGSTVSRCGTLRFVQVLIALIRCYQAMIRPHLIGTCKFCPTCSDYAIESLRTHGLFLGFSLSIRRLLRCHPFSPGGLDPVPSRFRAVVHPSRERKRPVRRFGVRPSR